MKNNKGKGIKQQILEVTGYEPTIYDSISKEQFDSLLDDLTTNVTHPDDMEIFTVDKGWHKVKDYR